MAAPTTRTFALPTAWRRPDVLIASLLINILALVLPLVVFQVYDRVIPNSADATLTMLILLAVTVTLFDGGIRVLRAILVSWSSARFEHRATLAAMKHMLQADTMDFESVPSGTHLERIQAIEQITEFYSGQAMLLAVDLPFAFLFMGLIWLMAGHLVAVPIALLVIFLITSLWAGKSLTRALRKKSTMDERRQNFIIEVLGAAHTVKSMAMEKLMMRRYERLQGQSAKNINNLGEVNSIVQGTTTTISHLAIISFVSLGSLSVISGDLTTGALAAGTMLTGRVLQPGLRALALWTQFQNVRLSIEKVREIYAMSYEDPGNFIPPSGALKGCMRLSNVHFRYPDTDKDIINGLSLSLQAGESIGISGRNGAGKSTLVGLMMGFLKPSQGGIWVDGRPICDFDLEFLRGEISLMPQKGVLFEGTVLENMTLFREGEAARQASELARSLGLDLFLSRLPEGLDTLVGGSAVDALPEGIRQKIIMIRALVGHPKIMIFDDANASFDMVNDQRLIKWITKMKGDRTLIIVSHRPSLLRLADRQFRLENGVLHTDRVESHLPRKPHSNTTIPTPSHKHPPDDSTAKARHNTSSNLGKCA